MINYSEYTDYDDLEELNMTFKGNPRKDLETDIYKVYLTKPIVFQLPKSKISEINELDYEQSVVTYTLEDDSLVNFLDNLDAYIINISNKHSLKWFGKNLEQKLLMGLYENSYSLENDMKYLKFVISDTDLEEVSNYNIDIDQDILLVIKTIDIFKRTFKLNFELDRFDYSDDMGAEEVDFEKLINSQKNVCDTNIVDEKSFSIRDDIIDGDLKSEVLELIKTKELEKETVLTNTKRINTASETLKQRVSDLDTEIKSFREKLDVL
uniref:Uncharacterized protein n=1 Tax=viral metagenome TaxID=1070528 RepID=A0A6C0B3S6_9ZZZZ